MNNNERELVPPEELPDDALDKVAGGMDLNDFPKYISYSRAFMSKNDCDNCNNYYEDNCPQQLDLEEIYKMFRGNPNATCPYKT